MTVGLDENPRALRDLLWSRSRDHCWYCGRIFVVGAFRTVDHIIPRRAGGSDDENNLVPACLSCNSLKSGGSLDEFRERLGRYAAGWPHFTALQIEWLRTTGLQFPPRYVFWFEQHAGGKPNEHPRLTVVGGKS